MYLSLAGALITSVSVLLPHGDNFDERGMLTIAACSFASAVVLFLGGGDRLPSWAFPVMLAAATMLVEWAIFASGEHTSPYAAIYFWIAIYAFYFFSRTQAILQVAFITAVYAAVLGFVPDPTSAPVLRWAITMSSLVVAGAMIGVLQERVARLDRDVRVDAPTDLWNKRAFHDVLDSEFERARRHDLPLALAVVEIDGLAQVDERGSKKEVFERIGALAQSLARDTDGASRIAPERLAFVLPHTDREGGLAVSERLLNALTALFEPEGLDLPVSIGLATFPTDAGSAEALLHAASQAVAAAEHLGRGRVVLYSPEIAGIVLAAESRRGQARGGNLAAVIALAEVLDIRDAGTAQHSQTVGRYSEEIARRLDLPTDLVERVRLAGILHDVGKIAVPDAILSKPDKLTPEEWAEMRKHPEVGALIVDGADMKDVAAWIGAHHERPDGNGYPHGLSDEEIPLEARILAVADAYEAMTCDRVYRRALPVETARAEMRKCAGTQFDPRVVDALLGWLEECDERGEAVENGHFASLVRGLSDRKLV
jgi:diguanylate cyclase (GGDEF)-like protein/putative nucleotidyltransferase with HDIG domain